MTNEQLAARIQAGENVGKNMAVLYDQVKDFIHAMAYKYHGQGELEDLEQEGFLALYAENAEVYTEHRKPSALVCGPPGGYQKIPEVLHRVPGRTGLQAHRSRIMPLFMAYPGTVKGNTV